jgi:hypothetical protein
MSPRRTSVGTCALCEHDMDDVAMGWYGAELPLCGSCRALAVVRFDQKYKGISIWGQNYAHVRLAEGEYSMKPWPYQGFDSKPNGDTFLYFRRMKQFIINEAASSLDERHPYVKATDDLLAPKLVYDVAPPRKKLTKKQQEEADRKQYQQQMLFADFPP